MTEDVLQAVNFALAIVNFAVATMLVVRGFSVSREIGAAGITASAQSAYQELMDSRADATSPDHADRFYDRFWAAQVLQYEQWRSRLVPDLIYWDWLIKRRAQYAQNALVAGISFQDAWSRRHEDRYKFTGFGKFMQLVLAEHATADESPAHAGRNVRNAMRRYHWGLRL